MLLKTDTNQRGRAESSDRPLTKAGGDTTLLPRPAKPGGRWQVLLMSLTCLAAVLAGFAAEFNRWDGATDEDRGLAVAATVSTVSTTATGTANPNVAAVAAATGVAGIAAVAPAAQRPRTVSFEKLSSSHIPMPQGVPSAHASSITAIKGDEMLAFWWAGSRESGPDVKVYSSHWDDGRWSAPREVASRESLGAALGFGVRRIGNPVVWTARDGTVNLFIVATGLGGWAASRIVHLVSHDHADSFEVVRVLPMSPLFNTSVLVRTTPVGLADGGWWLPAYFELGIKYPMIMAFDDDGEPEWLARIGERTTTLQPTVVPVSASEAHALMRDASDERKIQQAFSRDGGATWEDLPPLDLPNHSTSVAALRLSEGGFLLLHNHVIEGGTSRNILRLSVSQDARSWDTVFDVARGDPGEEFSYPTLQQVGDELHVTYTSRRTSIEHHVYRIAYGKELP